MPVTSPSSSTSSPHSCRTTQAHTDTHVSSTLTTTQLRYDTIRHDTIHTYIQTLDSAHNSQAQGLNLRRRRSLGGKRTVDINDEQTNGFLDEIRMSWNCWEIGWIAVTCSKQTVRSSWKHSAKLGRQCRQHQQVLATWLKGSSGLILLKYRNSVFFDWFLVTFCTRSKTERQPT